MKYLILIFLIISTYSLAEEHKTDISIFKPPEGEIFKVKMENGKEFYCFVSDQLGYRLFIKCFDKNFNKENN